MSLTGAVAGDSKWARYKLTVYLFEGTITPTEIEDGHGNERPGILRASKLAEGDLIELYDDAEFVYSNLPDGLPVVRAPSGAGSGYLGRIIDIEKAYKRPATTISALADMISGKYLRVATVEMIGMIGTALLDVTIPANTPADTVPVADPTKVVYDLGDSKFEFGTGTNTELVPLTRLTGATGAATTGPILFGIGLQKLQKAS